MEDKKILERLKEIIEDIKREDPASKWTNAKISKALDFSINYISDRVGGSKPKPITDDLLDRLQIVFLKSKDWIKTGKGKKNITTFDPGIDLKMQINFLLKNENPEVQRVLNLYYLDRLADIFSRLSGASPDDCRNTEYQKALTAVAAQPKDKD